MVFSIRVMASALLLASAATVAAAQPAACDRQCLEALVDRYLDALVRHDPLPCRSPPGRVIRRMAKGSSSETASGAAFGAEASTG